MYLGIDLGTSNSTIVGSEKGTRRVFKTPEGTDTLPSVIMLDRRGGLLVGRRAYDASAFSSENVAQGFKRLMGTSSRIKFSSRDFEITSEEASTEILKSLLSQARNAAGEFSLDGTVVTVPAAFNQMQSEATMSAAHAAGLEKVALLQEPIAAAMAAVGSLDNKDGRFLVYDLGGGTFDVAIVESMNGTITVVGHAGVNMLGGRDFDRAIVNSLVRLWLRDHFHLPEDFHREPKFQRLLRVAQYRAEVAKITLSTQFADHIFADETQIATKDAKGVDIYLDVEISREEVERIVSGEIDRSLELCQQLIIDNGYRSSDLDRVVLIGGPSRMPIIRERIASELEIATDLNVDPMTAVAMGAAVSAEGRDWRDNVGGPRKARASVKTEGVLKLRFDYPSRTADARVTLKIRVCPETSDGI